MRPRRVLCPIRLLATTLCWSALTLACACGSTASSAPDGAAPGRDGGATRDAGVAADAGLAAMDGGAAQDAGPPSDAGVSPAVWGRIFPMANEWNRDISADAKDAESDGVIAWLDAQGFGAGRMQIDFSIEVLPADARTPRLAFTPTDDHYTPDCDVEPIPVPTRGALEGESGYACAGDGDCHLIVIDHDAHRLYEMWRANIVGARFEGGCLAVWDLTRAYRPPLRGEQCTSADAAGLPIAALLFGPEEVAAGRIDHAIRFILPNARIRNGVYVWPATHSTRATSGPMAAPPYGARLRLRGDYPLASLPNEGARVVARALMRYGMILSDGGNIALTARSDRFAAVKWDGLLGPRDLSIIRPRDFVMVEAGARRRYTGDCVRVP